MLLMIYKVIISTWILFTSLIVINYENIGHGLLVFITYTVGTLYLIYKSQKIQINFKILQINTIMMMMIFKYIHIVFILNWIIFDLGRAIFFLIASFLLLTMYVPKLAEKVKDFNPKTFTPIQFHIDNLFKVESYTIENISMEILKKQYRILVKENHPDKGGDRDRFESIQESYEEIKKQIKMN